MFGESWRNFILLLNILLSNITYFFGESKNVMANRKLRQKLLKNIFTSKNPGTQGISNFLKNVTVRPTSKVMIPPPNCLVLTKVEKIQTCVNY